MIRFYTYRSAWGLASISPYCVFVETWMQMAGVPYERIVTSNRSAPQKVLPYAEDSGKVLPNPPAVHEHLRAITDDLLDRDLGEEGIAQRDELSRRIDDSLYWCFVYSRWADPLGYNAIKPTMRGFAPAGLGVMLVPVFRRGVLKMLREQGLADKKPDEVYPQGLSDIASLAATLGGKEWFLADKPSTLDALAYSVVANILRSPPPVPLKQAIESNANLCAFCDRVEERYLKGIELG